MAGLVSSGSIGPGESGEIAISMDTRGKRGPVVKTVTVRSNDPLRPIVTIPVRAVVATSVGVPQEPIEEVLFSNPCASCHVDPAADKEGSALYEAVCAMCHGPEMLFPIDIPMDDDPELISSWIADGVPGADMPGYSVANGGPLTDSQIEGLVAYLGSR